MFTRFRDRVRADTSPSVRAPAGWVRASLPLAAAVGLAGCDLPTEAPHWESRWILPAQTTQVVLDEFLPAGVTVAPDSSGFLIALTPFSRTRLLGELCSACEPVDGTTAPKPPFQSGFPVFGDLPADVMAGEIEEGRFLVEVTNGLSFDPLRPGAGEVGQLELVLYNEWDDGPGREIGVGQVDGSETALPPGSVIAREIPLVPGPLSPVVRAEVTLQSPEGEPVEIDVGEPFDVAFEPIVLLLSSVELDVSGRQVDLVGVELDLEDVSEDIVERVRAGGLVLDVENSLGVSLDMTFQITSPRLTTTKEVNIPAAESSSVGIALTREEIRGLLGQPDVMLTGSAVVSPSAPTVTVRPGQVLQIRTKVDLTILVGGDS